MSIPSPAQFKRIASRHWAERAHYESAGDWLMSIYNRILIHSKSLPLPGRRRVRSVQLSNLPAPLRVRLGSSDWYVVEEIFVNDEYGPLTRRKPTNIRTVLDLGANVGMSVRLWQHLWPSARIVAVEPDPGNVTAARENAEISEAPPIFIQACVAGHSRPVHLDRSKNEYGFKMAEGADRGEAIDALTVSQICERAAFNDTIDLLKCDVEGAEAEIFENCAPWINRVRYLVVEVHAPYNAAKLIDDLRRAGAAMKWQETIDKGDVAVVFTELGAA